MATKMRVTASVAVLGKSHTKAVDVLGDNAVQSEPDLAGSLAKGGTLTTRTDNTTGTLTLGSGHGITTAAVVDLFWAAGSRRGVTVGTVSGTSVPISGGTGDNLPSAATVVQVMVPHVETISVVGDNATGILVDSDSQGYVLITKSDDTVLAAYKFASGGGTEYWYAASGVTNPLAGQTATKVKYSHASTTDAPTLKAVLLYN